MEDKLRDVSDRIGSTGSPEDTKLMSELMDHIRDVGRQVNDKSQLVHRSDN